MNDSDVRLDGNAAGGLLGTIFAFEMTTARTICAGCGTDRAVGELMLYGTEIGTVIRCPGCDTVLIRVAPMRDGYALDMSGMRRMKIMVHTKQGETEQ